MKAILSIGILIIFICITGCLDETLVPSPSGEDYSEIDIYQEPIQEPYTGDVIYREADGNTYALVPVALYKTSVLVVHTKHYNDEDAELVPVDLCVVWGILAEHEYLQYTTFIQEDRGCECHKDYQERPESSPRRLSCGYLS